MPSELTEEGRYQAQAISWDLRDSSKSDSKGVCIVFMCSAIWDEFKRVWEPLPAPQPKIEAFFWFVGKDGMPNKRAVQDLHYVLKWSLDPMDFAEDHKWSPPACEITVKNENYEGKDRLRVKWINEPGSRGQGKEIAKAIASAQGDNFKRIIDEIEGRVMPADEPAPVDGEAPF